MKQILHLVPFVIGPVVVVLVVGSGSIVVGSRSKVFVSRYIVTSFDSSNGMDKIHENEKNTYICPNLLVGAFQCVVDPANSMG